MTVVCLGIAVQDLILSVDALPTGAGKVRARAMTVEGGGMAASAAAAIARLGGSAELWSRLGDDEVGDAIVRELEEHGVDAGRCARLADRTSPVSAVLVDADGERLIVNHTDPEMPDDPGWLPLERLAHAQAALVDTRWSNGALAVLEAARSRGLPAVLDADTAPEDPRLVEAASHAVFSEPALRAFTGCADPAAGLASLAAAPGSVVAVTCGGDGVHWRGEGGAYHLGAFDVEVVDTLGAGDVFHGALALALAERMPLEQAMRFAGAAAALKCTRFGGRAGTPRREEVEALLAAQG